MHDALVHTARQGRYRRRGGQTAGRATDKRFAKAAMARPMRWLAATLLVAGILFTGCTAPTDGADAGETIYTHQWTWGPGYGGGDALPEFEDSFAAPSSENVTVAIDWAIDAGRAAVVLTPPGGEAINLTDDATGGPHGDAETTVDGAAGQWEFRIPTWRGADGEFPAGFVAVRVIA